MDKPTVENMIYRWSDEKTMKYIQSCTDHETLYLYAFNYNWDDEFDAPEAILNNPACTLSTALCLFYGGDGMRVLERDMEVSKYLAKWKAFITTLYDRIIRGDFPTEPRIKFDPPVTKVEMHVMQKELKPEEMVFITPIDGVDCDIIL